MLLMRSRLRRDRGAVVGGFFEEVRNGLRRSSAREIRERKQKVSNADWPAATWESAPQFQPGASRLQPQSVLCIHLPRITK